MQFESAIEIEFCRSLNKIVSVQNAGCGEATLLSASFQDPHFSVDNTQFPLSGGEYVFAYTFTPSSPGSYNTVLSLTFDRGGVILDTQLTLSAVATQPFIPTLAARDQTVTVGDSVEITARVPTSLNGKPAPREVIYTVEFDADALTIQEIAEAPGWEILDWRTTPTGATISLVRTSTEVVVSQEEIFTISFRSSVAVRRSPSIQFSGASIDETEVERACLPFGDSVTVTLLDQCGTPTIRESLSKRRTLGFVQLSPNPTAGSRDPMISGVISSEFTQIAQLVFSDLHGRQLFARVMELVAGQNDFTVPSLGLPEGIYFLELGNDHHRDVRKIVLR